MKNPLTAVQSRLVLAEGVVSFLYLPHASRAVTIPFDSWTHLFFASHYLMGWWTPIDNRWYLGIDVTTYPPLLHQLLAAVAWPLTAVLPVPSALQAAYIGIGFGLAVLYPLSVYQFGTVLTSRRAAAAGAFVGAMFSGWWMLFYGYGQFPTLLALVFALFGGKALSLYLGSKRRKAGVLAVLLTAMVPMTHHFSTISVLPVLYGIVVLEHLGWNKTRRTLRRAVTIAVPAVGIAVAGIFPFVVFMLGATDRPVIPHGSRTSWLHGHVWERAQFWHVLLSGLLFLTLVPVVARAVDRNRALMASVVAAALFGLLSLGFTTPLPSLVYGGTADQLTYYRFAAWGGVLLLPAAGVAVDSLFGDESWTLAVGQSRTLAVIVVVVIATQPVMATQMTTLQEFTASEDLQPEVEEVASVMNTGENSRWRYLTLGMAQELGAIAIHAPQAQTIDGSYHRARQPRKVSRLVEDGTPQLSSAKYSRWGRDGQHDSSLPTLRYYLQRNEQYNLKYVFSADRFYAETLRESGFELLYGGEWAGLTVRAWYDPDTPPMDDTPDPVDGTAWYMYFWGTVPLGTLLTTLLVGLSYASIRRPELPLDVIDTPER